MSYDVDSKINKTALDRTNFDTKPSSQLTTPRKRRSSLFDTSSVGSLSQINESRYELQNQSGDSIEQGELHYNDVEDFLKFDSNVNTSTPTSIKSPLSNSNQSFIQFDAPNKSKLPIDNKLNNVKLRHSETSQLNHSIPKLHRIFSENETSNFNSINGRRMYDDNRYRPHRTRYYDPSSSVNNSSMIDNSVRNQIDNTRAQRFKQSRSFSTFHHANSSPISQSNFTGMEDEYIPNFDFSTAVKQWNDFYDDNSYDSSFDSSSIAESDISSKISKLSRTSKISRPSTPIGPLHSQVSPVSVPINKKDHTSFETDLTNEESLIISKLPQNFEDLPFSIRRKLIADLSPVINQDTLNKVIKKKFKRKTKSSPAIQFLSSFNENSPRLTVEGNVVLNHTLGRIIGFGAWGIIRECRSVTDGTINAMKVIHTKTESSKAFFKREVSIWKQLSHENVLPLIDHKETLESIYCLTLKASGGTLFDLVSKWGVYDLETNISISQRLETIRSYSCQIISGLSYIHQKGFVHGDVKLENCLIQTTAAVSKILICDFGMSLKYSNPLPMEEISLESNKKIKVKRRPSIPRSLSGDGISSSLMTSPNSLQKLVFDTRKTHDDTKLNIHISTKNHQTFSPSSSPLKPFEYAKEMYSSDPNLPHSHIGSLPYAAPELLESSPLPLGPAADIWAFGVLLYTMIVGRLPFQHSYEPRLRAMISVGKYDLESLEKATNYNKQLIQAVKGCLTLDLTKRFEFDEIHQLINVDANV